MARHKNTSTGILWYVRLISHPFNEAKLSKGYFCTSKSSQVIKKKEKETLLCSNMLLKMTSVEILEKNPDLFAS